MVNCKCGEKQYLIWGENGRLTCRNCGAEDTGEPELTEDDFDK